LHDWPAAALNVEPHATAVPSPMPCCGNIAGTRIPAIDATAWATLLVQIALHPVCVTGPAGIFGSLLA
jgi:hypothetical protein